MDIEAVLVEILGEPLWKTLERHDDDDDRDDGDEDHDNDASDDDSLKFLNKS